MGYMAEATVFGFVGIISAKELTSKYYCIEFAALMFVVVIVGRFAAVYTSYFVFSCCKGSPENRLSFKQLTFIAYAALIRGAIAFGLSQEITPKSFAKSESEKDTRLDVETVQTTILMLIISTTVIIGGLTPPV